MLTQNLLSNGFKTNVLVWFWQDKTKKLRSSRVSHDYCWLHNVFKGLSRNRNEGLYESLTFLFVYQRLHLLCWCSPPSAAGTFDKHIGFQISCFSQSKHFIVRVQVLFPLSVSTIIVHLSAHSISSD